LLKTIRNNGVEYILRLEDTDYFAQSSSWLIGNKPAFPSQRKIYNRDRINPKFETIDTQNTVANPNWHTFMNILGPPDSIKRPRMNRSAGNEQGNQLTGIE